MTLIDKEYKNKGESGAIPLNAENIQELVNSINLLDDSLKTIKTTLEKMLEHISFEDDGTHLNKAVYVYGKELLDYEEVEEIS